MINVTYHPFSLKTCCGTGVPLLATLKQHPQKIHLPARPYLKKLIRLRHLHSITNRKSNFTLSFLLALFFIFLLKERFINHHDVLDYRCPSHELIFDKKIYSSELFSYVVKGIKKGNVDSRHYFLLLLLSGDIEINPGPINPCSICLRSVARNHRAILCDNCNLWSHIKCYSMSCMDYNNLSKLDEFT